MKKERAKDILYELGEIERKLFNLNGELRQAFGPKISVMNPHTHTAIAKDSVTLARAIIRERIHKGPLEDI